MAGFSFRNVTKVFPSGKAAVKDFSLEIRDGEFLVLTGPERSGKATVLRMIAGMEPISSGELRIDGTAVENGRPEKRNVGMIFRHFTLYPGMTVYDNIGFLMKLRGEPEEKIRLAVEENAKIFKIEGLLSCYPRELNDLQKQYVAMARANVHAPEAFLMLDLLGELDASARKKARERLKSLYNEIQTTLVYATDDAKEAALMDMKTVVMRRGQIEQVGSVRELKEHPRNFFVAQFMHGSGFGSSEVEIVCGKTAVEAVGNGFALDVPPEWIPCLERGGYMGKKVLLGYTLNEPPCGAEDLEETAPEADSRFFFFDRETRMAIA
ncbi:MAG: ABC transporter ATP-binding protein [Lachnospiraceae bacterium]|nr:ABC transporter ATP-binding protein [Lachnospiraceae bacterium]